MTSWKKAAACDDGEDDGWMTKRKLFSPQVRQRAPSTLRTFGPSSFVVLRTERAQFTTSKSVAKETPPEAGTPASPTTIVLPSAR